MRRGRGVHGGTEVGRPACVHCTAPDPVAGLSRQREQRSRIVGVEPADEAIRLADLAAARERTIVVLRHEHDGIPGDAMELIDVAVEIPVIGTAASLNVAVAGLARPEPAGRLPVARFDRA